MVREHLAAVYENEEDWSTAAKLLAGIPLDSGIRVLEDNYKVGVYPATLGYTTYCEVSNQNACAAGFELPYIDPRGYMHDVPTHRYASSLACPENQRSQAVLYEQARALCAVLRALVFVLAVLQALVLALQAAMSAELLRFRMKTIRDIDNGEDDDDAFESFSSDSDDTVNNTAG